jgi:hypothetical protein
MNSEDAHAVAQLNAETVRKQQVHMRMLEKKALDMGEALIECMAYFEKHQDVRDGADGQPRPNPEAQLLTLVRDALSKVECRECSGDALSDAPCPICGGSGVDVRTPDVSELCDVDPTDGLDYRPGDSGEGAARAALGVEP